jgi:predicted GIY-YIG superfamily endonuclease
MNNYCLYWIHYPDQTDPKSEGYIGITSDFSSRMATHSKYAKYKHIYNRIQSGAIPEILWRDLSKEEAERLEEQMRPNENIGWNLAKGGNIPPSRKGKVSAKSLLKGDDRTENQISAALKHSNRMKGRTAHNATEVCLFGNTYKSIQEAIQDLNWSKSHYYKYKELVASGMSFDTPEQLKEYTYKLRNDKISQTRKEKGYHYNQYTK